MRENVARLQTQIEGRIDGWTGGGIRLERTI